VTTCVPAQPLIVAVSHAVPMPHPLALPLLPADIQHVPRSL
jgi:serine/threonine-protein kinase RIO1